MPVQTCFSNVYSTRFDFGVPLEDIFPPHDIHPRLKYLFGIAFQAYTECGSSIMDVLRCGQEALNERLQLKDKLVLYLNYHIKAEDFLPGTYFWLIRHFFGLLPLPLFPSYTKEVQFYWKSLAEKCKILLKCHYWNERKYLDYDIARTLNMLPLENILLINLVIQFIRKMAIKRIRGRSKFNRTSLIALTNYYCAALFVRPFKPGYPHKSEYHPLLVYLIMYWQNISQHCLAVGHSSNFLESDFSSFRLHSQNNSTQLNFNDNPYFNPEVITVCKNIPYFVNFYKCLKDMASQTDNDLHSADNMSEIHSNIIESREVLKAADERNNNTNAYKLAYIEEELDENHNLNEIDAHLDNDNTLYQTATNFSFNDTLNEDNNHDWKEIMQSTMETVKKVDGSYIYDDYETFKKEDYNQVGKNRTSSILSKLSKSSMKRNRDQKKISPESDNSYIKYSDVCSSSSEQSLDYNLNIDQNRDIDEIKVVDHSYKKDNITDVKSKPKIPISQRLFQDNNSPRSIQDEDSKQGLHDEKGQKNKRRRYLLNRLRMSLQFLRTITPRKRYFKLIESKVKYHRIRNGKRGKFNTI